MSSSVSPVTVFVVVSAGVTGTLASTTPIASGDAVSITLTDVDLDTDPLVAETLPLTTTNTVTGETELLTYTETGPNTGVFTATVATVFGAVAGTNDDGVFNVQAGDTLLTVYNDAATASGGPATVTTSTTVVSGLRLQKTSTTVDDPVNGSTNPKAIPGANVRYTLRLTNQRPGPVDADTVVVSDTLPLELDLFVNDLGGPGSGPVLFVDGTPVSGLTYTFVGLGDATDDLMFDDGSLTFTYTPVPDADGYDANVTAIRINPKGVFNGSGGGDPYFDAEFQMRVR